MASEKLYSTKLAALALIFCLALLGAASPAAAEEPDVLAAKVLHSMSAYAQGGTYPIAVELTIANGLHINSDRPSEPDLFPSSIKVPAAPGLTFGPFQWPAAQPYKPTWASKPIQVLEGTVILRATLTVAKDAKPGASQLTAKLTFQACDDQSCLMPDEVAIPITVNVVPAGSKADPLNPQVFK